MDSMTGYGFVEGRTTQFSFSVELRCLNSKYLEFFCNVPKILRCDEQDIQSAVKEKISRGKIELNIDVYGWNESRTSGINGELAKRFYKEMCAIEKELSPAVPFSSDVLFSFEGVVQRDRSVISPQSRKELFKAIDTVIKKAITMRQKEGDSIKKDIDFSLDEISKHMVLIKKNAATVAKDSFLLLKTRIESLSKVKIDDTRLYTEIAILADKLDINEETVRLADHIKKFKTTMKEKDQIGRKLDFVAQEMFREINTIASKSNNSEIAHSVVEVKNHIDKIREQCRNVV